MAINKGKLNFGTVAPATYGRPVKEIAAGDERMYKRAYDNEQTMNKLNSFAANIKVMEKDEANKVDAVNGLVNDFQDIVESGTYAYAKRNITDAANKFDTDMNLKYSVQQKAEYDAMISQAKKDGVPPERLTAYTNYIKRSGQRITVDERGDINGYTPINNMVKDPDVQGKIYELIKNMKESGKAIEYVDKSGNKSTVRYVNGAYESGTETGISADRVYRAAQHIVTTNPDVVAYFSETKKLADYSLYALDNEGMYIPDEDNGGFIKGRNEYGEIIPISYQDQLNRIGISDEKIIKILDVFNNGDPNDPNDKGHGTNYTIEDDDMAERLYNSMFMQQMITKEANNAVTIGAYNKTEYKRDDATMAILKYKHDLGIDRDNNNAKNKIIINKANDEADKKKDEIEDITKDIMMRNNSTGVGADAAKEGITENNIISTQYFKRSNIINGTYLSTRNTVNNNLFDQLPKLLNKTTDIVKWYNVKNKATGIYSIEPRIATLNPTTGGYKVNHKKNTNANLKSIIGVVDPAAYKQLSKSVKGYNELYNQQNEYLAKVSTETLRSSLKARFQGYFDAINSDENPNIGISNGTIQDISNELSKNGNTRYKTRKDLENLYASINMKGRIETLQTVSSANILAADDDELTPLSEYFKTQQAGFNATDLQFTSPETADEFSQLNTQMKYELESGTVYTADGKEFKYFDADERTKFFGYSNLKKDNPRDAAIMQWINTHESIDIRNLLVKSLNKTSKKKENLYTGYNNTGKMQTLLSDKTVSVAYTEKVQLLENGNIVAGKFEDVERQVVITIPPLFAKLPNSYVIKDVPKTQQLFNQMVAQLASSLDNTEDINLTNKNETKVRVVNNGNLGWTMYDYKGDIVTANTNLTEIWRETWKIVGGSISRADDPATTKVDESKITDKDIEDYILKNFKKN